MPSRREVRDRRRPTVLGSFVHLARRARGVAFWTTVAASGAYAVYRVVARPFRPANRRLALFLGKHLMEASGPCLAVTTRPVELERFAGGTLRRMVLAGIPVVVAVVTPNDELSERFDAQDEEALEAAHRIGYHRLQLLKVPAPFQQQDVEDRLEEVWNEVEPEVVVAFDPLDPLGWIQIPEERLCGEAALRLAERLDGERRVKLAFCGTSRPNALVEVTPILPDKIGAVVSHRTELSAPPLAINLGLRLTGRLPDLRGSFEALRILEPARRSRDQQAIALRRAARSAEPAPDAREVRRAVVRTRIPADAARGPEAAPSNYWASDGSVPEEVGASGGDQPGSRTR
ncbi:PIG-L deacetylase family protein [Limnochorda pilosa]|uniref:Uncharacterized protein n=1 Tax=Limnochorda pilosa TaxID=1555112 RepID=A0A0K2SLN1_LIMPI|nr:hypothetical protein [Limnochorda pilosa]BAS27724.1 hypothetical protein LIP_1882 [Limnochorda pilosa]